MGVGYAISYFGFRFDLRGQGVLMKLFGFLRTMMFICFCIASVYTLCVFFVSGYNVGTFVFPIECLVLLRLWKETLNSPQKGSGDA